MSISGVIAGCIESTFTGVVSGRPAGGDDPSVAEIVALLTAGGDAWDFSANVDPQPGVRGVLPLARGTTGLWNSVYGKIGGGYLSAYDDPGSCLTGDATDIIGAVFDGGDWSVNVWHRANLVFGTSGATTTALIVTTDTGTPAFLYTRTNDGITYQAFGFTSDFDGSNGVTLDGVITKNAYAMLTLTYTSATRTLRLYVNGSLADSGNIPGVTSTDFTTETGPVYEVAGAATPLGALDEAYGYTDLPLICKGVLSQDNIDYLYNSGAGRANSIFA